MPGRLWVDSGHPEEEEDDSYFREIEGKMRAVLGIPCCPVAGSNHFTSDGEMLWIDPVGRFFTGDDLGMVFIGATVEEALETLLGGENPPPPPRELRDQLRQARNWDNRPDVSIQVGICLQCGAEKLDALRVCRQCGFDPQSSEDACAKSLYLSTERYSDPEKQRPYWDELSRFAERIERGETVAFEPPELVRMAEQHRERKLRLNQLTRRRMNFGQRVGLVFLVIFIAWLLLGFLFPSCAGGK